METLPPSSIILSEIENNDLLINAGYTNTGYVTLPFNQKPTDSTQYGVWSYFTQPHNPGNRKYHSSIWTGEEFIVWGGQNANADILNTGAKFNPTTNTWIPMSTINAPTGRIYHSTIWTGTEMIIFGGRQSLYITTETGGRYNPVTNLWRETTRINATGRKEISAIWTGTEMMMWGGSGNFSSSLTGAKFNPYLPGYAPTQNVVRYLYKKNE